MTSKFNVKPSFLPKSQQIPLPLTILTIVLLLSEVEVREQENIPIGQKRKYSSDLSTENRITELETQVTPHLTALAPHIPANLPSENGRRVSVPCVDSSSVLPTSEYRVSVTTISPEWSFLAGGEKVSQ